MQGEIDRPAWWQTRAFGAAVVLASILPLLWPALPPLVDLPGHVGRYRIMAEAGVEPLAQHYAVYWAPIGNLGVDALVLALHPLIDIEPATHLIVMLVPALMVFALLLLGREVHGRVPVGAGFAATLAFAYPFQLGFVNFCLSAALALGGLALWLRLARTRPPVWRVLVFAPFAWLVWFTHSFGWAMLGLFVFGAEWQRGVEHGRSWWRAMLAAVALCLPMAFPVLAMIAGSDRMAGDTGDWFHWSAKAQWIVSLLRERWKPWDIGGVVVLACVLWGALRSRRIGFASVLGVPAMLGLAAFVLAPRLYQGGSYVDMRILPYVVALALLAIHVRPGNEALAARIAALGTAFFIARIAVTTVAFAIYANGQTKEWRALPTIPVGAAVLVLVNEPDSRTWAGPRFTHIAGLAIARRRVFVNEQWAVPGQQLIHPLHPTAAPLDRDPSHLVYPPDSDYRSIDFDRAIAAFDRRTFGYVWTIGFPPGRVHATDLVQIWASDRSALYRAIPERNARLSSAALHP